MKYRKFLMMMTALLMLAGCSGELPEAVPETEQTLPAAPWEWQDEAVSHSNFPMIRTGSRGFLFVKGDCLSVYNPATGNVTPVCYDPLCGHDLASDCAFRYTVLGSVPEQVGESLYWFDAEKNLTDPARLGEKSYRICKSDLTGREMKVLYRNAGNIILGMDASSDYVVFTEQTAEETVLLHRMDPDGGNLRIQPCGEGETIAVTSFAVLDGRIYYVSGGVLYSCGTDFSDTQTIGETGDISLYADAGSGKLIWCFGNVLRQYDPGTGETAEVYRPSGNLEFRHFNVTDEGIYFQLFDREIGIGMKYAEYTEKIRERGQNILYCYGFASGKVTETAVPEDLYFVNCTVKGSLLMGNRLKEDEYTGGVQGGCYFVWDMENGTVTEFEG